MAAVARLRAAEVAVAAAQEGGGRRRRKRWVLAGRGLYVVEP